jgi:hypothetical protein
MKLKQEIMTDKFKFRVSKSDKLLMEKLCKKLSVTNFSDFARWAIIDSLKSEIALEKGKSVWSKPYLRRKNETQV